MTRLKNIEQKSKIYKHKINILKGILGKNKKMGKIYVVQTSDDGLMYDYFTNVTSLWKYLNGELDSYNLVDIWVGVEKTKGEMISKYISFNLSNLRQTLKSKGVCSIRSDDRSEITVTELSHYK